MVCLHYYHGLGLTDAYADNLHKVVNKAQRGECIEVTAGADDICRACPLLAGSVCRGESEAEAEIRKLDQQAFALLGCRIGQTVTWKDIKRRVEHTSATWFEAFCSGCTWDVYCDRGVDSK